jgi:hypothetical protein
VAGGTFHVKRLEQLDQIALMQWASFVSVGARPLSTLLWHYPAGGWRSPREAAIFKSMGVQDGVPDLQLPLACGGYVGGWWELKAGRNQLTPNQIDKHTLLRGFGHYVNTYWHWQECALDIEKYLRKGTHNVVVRARL